jgi:hypothetical protein
MKGRSPFFTAGAAPGTGGLSANPPFFQTIHEPPAFYEKAFYLISADFPKENSAGTAVPGATGVRLSKEIFKRLYIEKRVWYKNPFCIQIHFVQGCRA